MKLRTRKRIAGVVGLLILMPFLPFGILLALAGGLVSILELICELGTDFADWASNKIVPENGS